MKPTTLKRVLAVALIAGVVVPVRLTAQGNQDHERHHVRYSLEVLGTLGGTLSVGQGLSERVWSMDFPPYGEITRHTHFFGMTAQ